MTHEQDAALLVAELRRDTELDDELELEALTRVRRRLLVWPVPRDGATDAAAPPPRALQPGQRLGRRAGLVMALAAGTALGAAGHAVVTFVIAPATKSPVKTALPAASQPPTPRAPLGAAIRAPLPQAPAASARASAEAPPRMGVASEPPPPAAPTASFNPARGLAAELEQLERARRALAAHRADEALRALHLHAQRYPASVLTQEREALEIKALVDAGRISNARAAAERFLSRYPQSTLRGSIQRALESIQ